MLYLIYDHSDSRQTFELLEPIGPDLMSYAWFNSKTLDDHYNRSEGTINNTTLEYVMHDSCWQVIATFNSMPTATDLHSFLESSPELFI